MSLGKVLGKYEDKFYFVFRILVGFLFFQHGAQKLFGWFGAKGTVPLVSLFGLAGVIEFFGGLLLIVGLFTRTVAIVSAVNMVGALIIVHFPLGWSPINNNGELALLYFAAFLVLMVKGAGMYSLDKKLFKKM